MNRHDILLLQNITGYPCVTITLPTHRSSPENRQDPIRVRNLVKQAADRLLTEFGAREVEVLLRRLQQLAEGIDYRNTLDGLALFVNSSIAHSYRLPFTLNERIVVDETFYTRDLVFAMNRTPRYWTLVLSEKPTRLFEGSREDLVEIQTDGFPITHEGPGGTLPLPGGTGINKSAHRDERHRQFFRAVDSALAPFLADDPLPLALVGVDRHLAFFTEVTAHRNAVLTTLTGSHDVTAPHELGKLVWPLVKANLAEQREKVFQELDRAIGERKYVSGPVDAWRLAKEGRGRILLVEEDFHFPARVDDSGMHITAAEDVTAPDVIDDAVDDTIESILDKQGRVVFVDNGTLKEHQRTALILRY